MFMKKTLQKACMVTALALTQIISENTWRHKKRARLNVLFKKIEILEDHTTVAHSL